MFKKFVKDRAHNRYTAYCCDDIDERVGKIEEALAALVAGTVPDGAVTLPKLADDARTYTREINKGTLFAEWIGTEAEHSQHLTENGGAPLPNVRYTITDAALPPQTIGNITKCNRDFPVGTILAVDTNGTVPYIGTSTTLYIGVEKLVGSTHYCTEAKIAPKPADTTYITYGEVLGKWVCCGVVHYEASAMRCIYQRIE